MAASSTTTLRQPIDGLRHLATALAVGVGVAPPRASALATQLLWFDAVGASSHGISTLPTWLERIDRREIDPMTEGRAGRERAGTAVFDARHGLPPLALEVAAGIASEKARDVGIGIVRVENIGMTGPAAPIAANLAIGPFVAIIAGPEGAFTVALPTAEGWPLIHDSRLESLSNLPARSATEWSPWVNAFAGSEGWVIVALSVTAFEPLEAFHERVSRSIREIGSTTTASRPGPAEWEARRRQAREQGIEIDPFTLDALKSRADRAGVDWSALLSL